MPRLLRRLPSASQALGRRSMAHRQAAKRTRGEDCTEANSLHAFQNMFMYDHGQRRMKILHRSLPQRVKPDQDWKSAQMTECLEHNWSVLPIDGATGKIYTVNVAACNRICPICVHPRHDSPWNDDVYSRWFNIGFT